MYTREASALDLFTDSVRLMGDATECAVMEFDRRLEPSALEEAAQACLLAHPILHSRLVRGNGPAFWEMIEQSRVPPLQVEKCTGTTAAGSGTVLLTNDSNAGFETDAVADTYQTGSLTATAASLRLAMTDRLAVDFNGTLTGLAGVVIVVLFEPTYDRKEVSYVLQKNANFVDASFFIADRDYEILAAYASWGTAASSGNVQLTLDVTADAPGAGTNLLTNDTNAGFQYDGTANTPELATWYTTMGTPKPLVLSGDRLSLDFNGTTSLADLVVTVSLQPV